MFYVIKTPIPTVATSVKRRFYPVFERTSPSAPWSTKVSSAPEPPQDTHPGKDGTSTTNIPSSSCSIRIRYFIFPLVSLVLRQVHYMKVLPHVPGIKTVKRHVAAGRRGSGQTLPRTTIRGPCRSAGILAVGETPYLSLGVR